MAKSGVVLAVFLTAVGYLASYFYNFGYLSYFKIPSIFINITTPSLVFNIAITVFVGFASFFYLARYLNYEKKHNGKKRLIFLRAVWIVGVVLIILYSLGILNFSTLLIIASCIVFVLIIVIGRQVIKTKSLVGGWKEYWKLWREGINKDDPVLDLLPARINDYLGIAILAVGVSFVIGGTSARIQNDYPLTASKGDIHTLIISKNDSELITKEYNVSKKSFEDGYSIETISTQLRVTTFQIRVPSLSIYDRLQLPF